MALKQMAAHNKRASQPHGERVVYLTNGVGFNIMVLGKTPIGVLF